MTERSKVSIVELRALSAQNALLALQLERRYGLFKTGLEPSRIEQFQHLRDAQSAVSLAKKVYELVEDERTAEESWGLNDEPVANPHTLQLESLVSFGIQVFRATWFVKVNGKPSKKVMFWVCDLSGSRVYSTHSSFDNAWAAGIAIVQPMFRKLINAIREQETLKEHQTTAQVHRPGTPV